MEENTKKDFHGSVCTKLIGMATTSQVSGFVSTLIINGTDLRTYLENMLLIIVLLV